MRRFLFSLMAGTLWIGVSPGWAQPPKALEKKPEPVRAEEKTKASVALESVGLEKMIAEGLKNNPDVRIAEFRVGEAEALLQRTRMRVVADISGLQADIDAGKAELKEAETESERTQKLFQQGTISREAVRAAALPLERIKRELVINQAKMPYLLGMPMVERQEKMKKVSAPHDGSLEQRIAQGLKSNPDVRVAESRVKEAEAVLQQTRVKVGSEILGLQAVIDAVKATFDDAKIRFENAQRLFAQNVIGVEEHRTAQLALAKAKRELAVQERKMPFLLGRRAAEWQESANSGMPARSQTDLPAFAESFRPGALSKDALKSAIDKLDAALVEKLRKALDNPIKLATTPPETKFSLTALTNYLRENLPGISLYMHRFKTPDARLGQNDERPFFTFRVKEPIPLGAFLQFLEDELNAVFIVRDYGLVMVPSEGVPPGAIRVHDFWKLGK